MGSCDHVVATLLDRGPLSERMYSVAPCRTIASRCTSCASEKALGADIVLAPDLLGRRPRIRLPENPDDLSLLCQLFFIGDSPFWWKITSDSMDSFNGAGSHRRPGLACGLVFQQTSGRNPVREHNHPVRDNKNDPYAVMNEGQNMQTTQQLPQTERFHSLDALRGFALLLGVFFHAAESFCPERWSWAVLEKNPL